MTVFTSNTEDTEKLGRSLSSFLYEKGKKRVFIALRGEMGVGKTAFTRGFCSALEVSGVKSPTYTVVNEYKRGNLPVVHFDMYRIEDEDDLFSIGFYDYLTRDGYALCEWSENIEDEIPDNAIFVTIEKTDKDEGERKRGRHEGICIGRNTVAGCNYRC